MEQSIVITIVITQIKILIYFIFPPFDYLTINLPTIPLLCNLSISKSYSPGLIGTNFISISPSLSNSISFNIGASISTPSISIERIQMFLKTLQLPTRIL